MTASDESPAPKSLRGPGGTPPHEFVRSDDPNFGVVYGGACAADVDGASCGWPEPFHRADRDPSEVPALLANARRFKH